MTSQEPKKRKYSGDSEEIDSSKKNRKEDKKEKKIFKRQLHIEITKDITYDNLVIKYNTPTIIYYNNKEFKINTRKYYEQYKCTWKFCNFRRKKDKAKDQKYFCNVGIKGIRDAITTNKYKFFLLEDHKDNCANLGIIKRKKVTDKKKKGLEDGSNNTNNDLESKKKI